MRPAEVSTACKTCRPSPSTLRASRPLADAARKAGAACWTTARHGPASSARAEAANIASSATRQANDPMRIDLLNRRLLGRSPWGDKRRGGGREQKAGQVHFWRSGKFSYTRDFTLTARGLSLQVRDPTAWPFVAGLSGDMLIPIPSAWRFPSAIRACRTDARVPHFGAANPVPAAAAESSRR